MPNAEDPDMSKKQRDQSKDIRFRGETVSPEMANDSNASSSKEVTLHTKKIKKYRKNRRLSHFVIVIQSLNFYLFFCFYQDTFTDLDDLESIASFPIKPLQALKYDLFLSVIISN